MTYKDKASYESSPPCIKMCPHICHIDTYVYIYVSTYILYMHIYWIYIDPHICESNTYISYRDVSIYLSYRHVCVHILDICVHIYITYAHIWDVHRSTYIGCMWVSHIHPTPISVWTHTCEIHTVAHISHILDICGSNTYFQTYIYVDTYVCDQWSQRQTHMCEIYQHLHLYGHDIYVDTYIQFLYICMDAYVSMISEADTYVWDISTPISVWTHMCEKYQHVCVRLTCMNMCLPLRS